MNEMDWLNEADFIDEIDEDMAVDDKSFDNGDGTDPAAAFGTGEGTAHTDQFGENDDDLMGEVEPFDDTEESSEFGAPATPTPATAPDRNADNRAPEFNQNEGDDLFGDGDDFEDDHDEEEVDKDDLFGDGDDFEDDHDEEEVDKDDLLGNPGDDDLHAIYACKSNACNVPIVRGESGTYYVMGTDLKSYMEFAGIDDPKEALNNIMEANGDDITKDNIKVVSRRV